MMQYQIDATERVRIGVVGVGSHCYRNILPTLTYLPVELVAVADVDADRAAAVGRQYGARSYASAAAMYEAEQLDAVLICVSPRLHPQLTIEAFKAGLHVWMEKPAAMRATEVSDMIAARGDLVGVVSYKKAFMPATRKAVELLAEEGNAPVRSLLGVYPLSLPEDGPKVLAENAKSAWLSNGCHPLALLLELGGEVEQVTTHRSRHDGGAVILHHTSGAISNLHLPKGVPNTQPNERYLIAAGKRSIEIENSRRLTYQRGIDFSYTHGTSFAQGDLGTGAIVWEAQDSLNSPESMSIMTQGIYGALSHFITAVAQGTPATIGNLEFALHLTQVWEAVLMSQGQTVDVARD